MTESDPGTATNHPDTGTATDKWRFHTMWRPGAVVVTAAFVLCVCFPFNGASPNGLWQVLWGCVITGAVVSSIQWFGPTRSSAQVAGLVAALAVLAVTFTLIPERMVSVTLLVAAAVVGAAASRVRGIDKIVGLCILVSLISMMLSFFNGFEILEYMGVDLRIDYPNSMLYRATGLMGHPLLSSFVCLMLACGLAVRLWTRTRGLAIFIVLSVGLLSAVFTGTRSVLLTTVLACFLAATITLLTRPMKHVTRTAYLLGVGFVSVLVYLVGSIATKSNLRVFDFANLRSEASFENRADTLTILSHAQAAVPCPAVCSFVGRGFRRSTDYFEIYNRYSLVKTFDNSYVTVLFDFGLVGVTLLIAALLIVAFLGIDIAGKVLVAVVIFLPGFFFDSVYSVGAVCASAFLITSAVRKKDTLFQSKSYVGMES